jgi:hypothetical protein
VGSGAFIIAMLEELVAVSEALDGSRGDDRNRFQLKEEFIADTLYGVDIDAGGIELCKFRVWLHLMQDLDVDHEEFLDSNEEFALPNLGFKFFVGNSLVGEHDPTNVDAQQATLTGGLDETLEEIHEVRTKYQTVHGKEKDRLTERLDELTAELETQLAVEKGDWMDPVADAAEETFAWTTNIPEVILEGGFDIVIGNPPYEGQSQQDYIGELARFYDEKYDFYKTIPRMRHDLYQKFNIRGWELTREGGVLSYITSNTFYTIGSKQTTRNLLQQNRLLDLLEANPDTFDATVSPAVFSLRKRFEEEDYTFSYVDATETGIEQYRSLIGQLIEREESTPAETDKETYVRSLNLGGDSSGYVVPIELYRTTLRNAFFEPTEVNIEIHKKHMSRITSLADTWEYSIRDSDTLEENLSRIKKDHINSLEEGDVSILGLMTLGGVGLQTGNNERYLSYIQGSESAEEVRDRNNDFSYNSTNENAYSYISRVITNDRVADPSKLSDDEKLNGIKGDTYRVWVPIEKGFRNSDIYYKPNSTYINWSRESVTDLQNSSAARWQGYDYFFQEGFFSSRGGFSDLKVRYTNNAVIDSTGVLFTPIDGAVSAKYLIGLLNSELGEHITDTFINSSGKQATDMRHIPVPIPNSREESQMTKLVDQAIEIQKGELNENLSEVQEKIDQFVETLYGVEL